MGRLLSILFGNRARRKFLGQRGLTLIEVALGLGVLAIGAASMAEHMADNARTIRTTAAASKLNEVHQAADRMVAEMFDDIVDEIGGPGGMIVIPVGRAAAGDAVPDGPGSLPSLQSGGFLSPSYVDRNSYNQRHAVLVRDTSVDPDEPRLSVLVTTWDGNEITDEHLARMSGYIGSHGGVMLDNPPSSTPTNTVIGSFGGWQADVGDWSASWNGNDVSPSVGRAASHFVMSRDERGIRVNEFLHRVDVPGQPELNQMAVDLDMDSHDIDNIDQFYADGGEITNNLDVGRDLGVNRDINVGRHAQVGSNVTVGSSMIVGMNISVGGSVSAGNNVSAANNVGAGINVTAGNNVRAQNNVETVGGDLISGRDASVARDIDVARDARVGHRMGIGVPLPTGNHQGFQNTLAVSGNIATSDGGIILNSNNGSSRPSFVQWRHGNSTNRNLFACFDDSGDEITGRRRLAFGYNAPLCVQSPRIHFDISGPSAEDQGSGHFMGNLSTGHDLIAERDLEVDRHARIANRLIMGGIPAPASTDTGDIVAKDIWLDDVKRWASEGVYYANIVSSNQNIDKPQCRAGATPHIFLSPVFFSDNGNGRPLLGVRALAENHSTYWRTRLTVFTPNASGSGVQEVTVNASYGRMMALVKCMV